MKVTIQLFGAFRSFGEQINLAIAEEVQSQNCVVYC